MVSRRGIANRPRAGKRVARTPSGELVAEARKLSALPEAAQAKADDARFGPLIHDLNPGAISAKDLAERLIAGTDAVGNPQFAARRVRQLREKLVSLSQNTLEEEFRQIFAPSPQTRNQQIVINYYGWEDGKKHTLAEVGARYGMTRERTRQICAKTVRRQKPSTILAPVLDRTLAMIRRRLPSSAEALEREMVEAGITVVGLGLDHVAAAAKLLHRPVPFSLAPVGRALLAVRPRQEIASALVVEAARKEVYYHGLSTVDAVCSIVAEKGSGPVERSLVAEMLQLMDGFRWLDRGSRWFQLRSIRKHGLPRALEKILAVAGSIRLADLRAAIRRNRRIWNAPLPDSVLLEYCRQSEGVLVEGGRIASKTRRPWQEVLNGVEAQLVEILQEHGPVLERGVLEDLCVQRGMNRFSFHAFIASSPVIAQYGHGVYGLLGAKVPPKTIHALVARRRANHEPARVLDSHGMNEDGTLWLSYRLSKATNAYAVITVPSVLKKAIRGSFRLLTDDGREVGTLAAKDGRAWGLGTFLRQQGAQIDDRVVITLDLESRTAVISLESN